MAAKYIFGEGQLPGVVSKLSGTTKNFTAGLMSDPQKMENIISMVRTVTPLTSAQTVTKVNTYLPLFEKVSTLLGMYSFLNRAQTFRPIEPLNSKSPVDMMSTLMKSGNLPIGKMLAQPLIANNMDKIMGSVASNMLKNGGLNDLFKGGNMGDILNNGNINEMLSAFNKNSGNGSGNNLDLSSLMETFMPIINSMSSDNSNDNKNYDNNHDFEKNNSNNIDTPRKLKLKNENYLPDDEDEISNDEITYDSNYDKYDDEKDKYDRNYKKERYDNYEKAVNYDDNKNNYSEKNNFQRPIRIKQRKRR